MNQKPYRAIRIVAEPVDDKLIEAVKVGLGLDFTKSWRYLLRSGAEFEADKRTALGEKLRSILDQLNNVEVTE